MSRESLRARSILLDRRAFAWGWDQCVKLTLAAMIAVTLLHEVSAQQSKDQTRPAAPVITGPLPPLPPLAPLFDYPLRDTSICLGPDGISGNIDASLFQDDDGKVYYVYGNGKIALMKDDMSGFAESPRQLSPSGSGRVGFEGTYLFKANGKYHIAGAEFVNGDYHCYAAFSDKIYGPYSERYLAIPHAGHNTFFKDKEGNWWATFFGNSANAPFREKPGAMRIEFTTEGRIRPLLPKSSTGPVGDKATLGKLSRGESYSTQELP